MTEARRWEWGGPALEILVSTLLLPGSLNVKRIWGAARPHP